MALFTAPGPNGETLQIDAPDEAAAAQAVQEMAGGSGQHTMQGGGGVGVFSHVGPRKPRAPAQQPAGGVGAGAFEGVGVSSRDQFATAFDPSQDSAATAEGLDQRLNGEADDRGRWATAGNALTMGFGDEALGTLAGGLTWIQGEGFEKGYRAITEGVRNDIAGYAERHPVEHGLIDAAASIPTMVGGVGAARAGVTRFAPKVGQFAGKVGQKVGAVGRSAAGGAGYGAARGYGEGEGDVSDRLEQAGSGAIIGAGIGAGAGVVGKGVGQIVGSRAGKKVAPSLQQIEDQASALYQQADNAGVVVMGNATARLAKVKNDIGNMIADPNVAPDAFKTLYPNTMASLQVLDSVSRQGISLRNVESYRRVLLDAVLNSDKPADERMASIILGKYDDWVKNIHHSEFVGNGADARQIYVEARRLWKVKSKAQTIEAIAERAQNATVDSFGNAAYAQALVTGFKRLLSNPALMRGFSDAERKMIKAAAGGKMTQKALGAVDKATPGASLGRAAQAGAWAYVGGPAAIPAAAAGLGSRVARNRSIIKAAGQARDGMLNGGQVPFDPIAAREAGDYASRLTSAAALPTGTREGRQILDLGNVLDRGVPARMIPAR